MALYFAIPFGVYALAKLFNKAIKISKIGNTNKYDITKFIIYIITKISILLVVFILSNLIIWYPFIKSDGIEGISNIFARIFPIRRGIFEDKVATFWCVLHNFYKVNTIFDRPT
jgi:alpha-1,3-glucosyltransferase